MEKHQNLKKEVLTNNQLRKEQRHLKNNHKKHQNRNRVLKEKVQEFNLNMNLLFKKKCKYEIIN